MHISLHPYFPCIFHCIHIFHAYFTELIVYVYHCIHIFHVYFTASIFSMYIFHCIHIFHVYISLHPYFSCIYFTVSTCSIFHSPSSSTWIACTHLWTGTSCWGAWEAAWCSTTRNGCRTDWYVVIYFTGTLCFLYFTGSIATIFHWIYSLSISMDLFLCLFYWIYSSSISLDPYFLYFTGSVFSTFYLIQCFYISLDPYFQYFTWSIVSLFYWIHSFYISLDPGKTDWSVVNVVFIFSLYKYTVIWTKKKCYSSNIF